MKKEYGRIGQRRYGGVFFEEFRHELRGAKGVEVYQEMSENDETVGAILFAIEMLMRQCDFTIESAGSSEADQKAAQFVSECMDDMQMTWTDTLSEILSFLVYGWSYHEIVYKIRRGRTRSPETNSKYDDGLIGWRKLPIRAQDTLYQWEYEDNSDELIGMTQMPPPAFQLLTIPIDKALHFKTKSRKNNPEGHSILRTAYRSWYFKKRIQEIEGIGIERDLAGFPVLYVPDKVDVWNPDDPEAVRILAIAESIVSGVRRDAREGLVLPGGADGWKFELLSSGSRRQFDTNQIIDRYDKRIATTVLADFVMLGQQEVGSFALASNKTKIFALAIGTYLDVICETFNNQGIPRLIDLNSEHFKGITDYPRMVHGDIEDADLENVGNFIQRMVSIGALQPDNELEDYIRRISGLPERVENQIPHDDVKPKNDKTDKVQNDNSDNSDDELKDQLKAEAAKKSLGRL